MNDSGPYPQQCTHLPTYPTHSPAKIKLLNDDDEAKLVRKLEEKKRERERKKVAK
jgi:hypothetical protein